MYGRCGPHISTFTPRDAQWGCSPALKEPTPTFYFGPSQSSQIIFLQSRIYDLKTKSASLEITDSVMPYNDKYLEKFHIRC